MKSANIVILHDLLMKVIYEHFIEVLSIAMTHQWQVEEMSVKSSWKDSGGGGGTKVIS